MERLALKSGSNLDSSSEDEVFFGPLSAKEESFYRKHGNRRTEQYFPFRPASEDYFADVSRGQSNEENDSPASAEKDAQEIAPMVACLGAAVEFRSDRPRRAKILSFQQFSSDSVTPVKPQLDCCEKPQEMQPVVGVANVSQHDPVPEIGKQLSKSRDSGLDITLSVVACKEVPAGGHDSNLSMAELNLSHLLSEPFQNCSVEQETSVLTDKRESGSSDDGWTLQLTPGATDSDCDIFRMWNQQLTAAFAHKENSQQLLPDEKDETRSPLVEALQLSPTRPKGPEKTSPLTLESLDLSVDIRLPVDSYLEIEDKENLGKPGGRRPQPAWAPMREVSNLPTPTQSQSAGKKTMSRIPVVGSRHSKCFSIYSSNHLQELKARSMRHWQHVSSPVGQYIKQDPVPPLVYNVRPTLRPSLKAASQARGRLLPLPSPLSRLPVAKYNVKGSTPLKVEQAPSRYAHKYFPSPSCALVIKHKGPTGTLKDVSYLRGEESLDANKKSSLPLPAAEESTWQVVSPKQHPK